MKPIIQILLLLFFFQINFSQNSLTKELSSIYDSLHTNITYKKREQLNKKGLNIAKSYIHNQEMRVFYYKFLLNLGDLNVYYSKISDSMLNVYNNASKELENENLENKDSLITEIKLLLVYFYQTRLEYNKAEIIINNLIKEAKEDEKSKIYQNLSIHYMRKNDIPNALKYIDQAINYSSTKNDTILVTNNLMIKGNILFKSKNYLESFKILDTAITLIQNKNATMRAIIYGHIANVYNFINDYEKAELKCKQAIKLINENSKSEYFRTKFCLQLAEIYLKNDKLDSCEKYLKKTSNKATELNKEFDLRLKFYNHQCYLNKNNQIEEDSAISYLKNACGNLSYIRPERRPFYKAITHYLFANVYYKLHNYKQANLYIDSCLAYNFDELIEFNFFVSYKKIYELASEVKVKINKKRESYLIYQKAYKEIDKISKNKLEAEITKLKVKQILRDKEAVMADNVKQKEKTIEEIILMTSFLLVVIFIVVLYILRLKTLRINNKLLELNNKFTQTQIAPHFIANTLANIQSKIFEGKKREANQMLGKFSELSKLLIFSVKEKSITLAQELDLIEKYVYFQRERKKVFEYEIIAPDNIDKTKLILPPLVSQPFIENAIEHGLFKKNSGGFLKVIYSVHEKYFRIKIEDNGVGMNSEDLKKQKSYSYKILEERLIIFNQMFKDNKFLIKMKSEKNKGTEVIIQVPYTLK